jgi:hypothetical protein
MADNLSLSLTLSLKNGKLISGLQQSQSSIGRFASGVRTELNSLKNHFNSLAGRIAQIGISISAVKQIMDSAKLDQSIARIGDTASASKAQIVALREELFNMAKKTGNSVEDLKSGFDSLIASGQSWDEAFASIKAINVAMATTGASGKTLADALTVASTAFDFDLSKPGEALKFLDEMVIAGKEGRAELESLADIMSRIGVNSASAGMNRQQSLAFVETLSLIERQPDRLATLADSTLRLFNNQNYSKTAEESTGVKFFNKDGSRREVMTVITEMKYKYDNLKTDKDRNQFVFDAFGKADLDTQKGIKTLFTGDSIQKYEDILKQISTAEGSLSNGLSNAIDNAVSQTGRLKAAMREAADSFAKPVNDAITNAIKYLMDPKADGGLELSGKEMIGGAAAATVAAYLASVFGGKAVKGVTNKFTGIGEGVAVGKTLESAAGIMPVFVVNMPAGGVALGLDPGMPANSKLPKVKKAIAAGGEMLAAPLGIGIGSMLYTSPLTIGAGNLIKNEDGRSSAEIVAKAISLALSPVINKLNQPFSVSVNLDGKQISNAVSKEQGYQSSRR